MDAIQNNEQLEAWMQEDPELRDFLLLVAPLLLQPPRPTATTSILQKLQGVAAAASSHTTSAAELLIASDLEELDNQRPRPAQGGQRITEEWLRSLSSADCVWRFRMTADEIIQVAEALDIPEEFKVEGRYNFSHIEALCLLLARFRTAADQYNLTMLYDRSQSSISRCINELVAYIDTRWGHLLDFDHDFLLHPTKLAIYSVAINQQGGPSTSVFGFVDCTIRRICRPSEYQRQAYNGHKKVHSLKFQAVVLLNGMFDHLFGPMEGHQNDAHLLKASHLMEICAVHARRERVGDNAPIEDRFFQVFGDPAYGVGAHIMSLFSNAHITAEQRKWNAEMAAVRIEVEHAFGIVVNTWPFLNAA
ncbi:hypothetical protein EWM64_g10139 [Hericium alpestre]|uniref:DDE Tnp4 domain-containing protein n=1 Tax=Hericium alpestre TaxID=135208 RepID=A0A4Y9ZHH3_9AGAM|nr:hypothetical protein EWM64_g10139 [Hericium alpestre]